MALSPYHDGDFPDISAFAYADFAEGFTDAQGIEHRRLLWQHAGNETEFEFCGEGRLYPAAGGNPAFYGVDIDDANGYWSRSAIHLTAAAPIWLG